MNRTLSTGAALALHHLREDATPEEEACPDRGATCEGVPFPGSGVGCLVWYRLDRGEIDVVGVASDACGGRGAVRGSYVPASQLTEAELDDLCESIAETLPDRLLADDCQDDLIDWIKDTWAGMARR